MWLFGSGLARRPTLFRCSAVHTNWKDDLWPGQPRPLSRSALASRSMVTCQLSSDPVHRIAHHNQDQFKSPAKAGLFLTPSKRRPDAPLLHGGLSHRLSAKARASRCGAHLNKATLDCAGIYFRPGAYWSEARRRRHASNRTDSRGRDVLLSPLRSTLFSHAFAAAQE